VPEPRRSISLTTKPDFQRCMERIDAWYEQQIIDRPPVRFAPRAPEEVITRLHQGRSWPDFKAKWFDAQFQVDLFLESLTGQLFLAETFPVFWPNLGPEVYAAFYGGELVYKEFTSYYAPTVHDWPDAEHLKLDFNNQYFRKLEEMTKLALDACEDRYLVGYTDIHAGVDCAAAWRDPQQFCMDFILHPKEAKELIQKASADFLTIYDHFDRILKAHNQPSVTWMPIPSFGRLHIPSCDFAAMISTRHFVEFCLPVTLGEVPHMTHNIFHIDGKGVAQHLDYLLDIPEIRAYQYVQGAGDDLPILQWLPQLKRIQRAGKSLVIDIQLHELAPFMQEMRPEGVFLGLDVDPDLQPVIIKMLERW
jgi:hypothetical protein